jgi:branched-chain amino acid transport system substrate-binding protein/neutral amino acid transport system substrate-binding protein
MTRSTNWPNTAETQQPPSSTIGGLRGLRGWRWLRHTVPLLLLLLTGCSTIPISFSPLTRYSNRTVNNMSPTNIAPLKLGLLLSFSGYLSSYGNTMQDSARLLVETVNSCGGVAGQAVQLLSEDDQSNAAAGKTAMTRLIQTDHVGAVIGAIGSEISNATVGMAVKNQIVQISPASANPILTARAKKGELQGFWFRTMPPDTFQGEALAQVAQQRGFKNVSILTIDNDYGNSIAQAFEKTFKRLGGKISGLPSRYSSYAGLYNVDLTTPFTGQPDAVLVVAEPILGSAILKSAYASGLWTGNTKVLLTSSMKTDSLAGEVGQSIDGRYIASGVVGIAPTRSNQAMGEFRDLYKKRFNREPGLYDPNTWDAAAVIVLAAEAANATTGTAIKAKIPAISNPSGIQVSDICQALSLVREGKDIDYQGASGMVDFNSSGDVTGNYDIWTVDYTGRIKTESTIQVGAGKNG